VRLVYLWWTFFLSAMMLAMLPNTLEQNRAIQPQSLAYTIGNNGGEREGRKRDGINGDVQTASQGAESGRRREEKKKERGDRGSSDAGEKGHHEMR